MHVTLLTFKFFYAKYYEKLANEMIYGKENNIKIT